MLLTASVIFILFTIRSDDIVLCLLMIVFLGLDMIGAIYKFIYIYINYKWKL